MIVLLRAALLVALIVGWIWCVVDVVRSDAARIRTLPKIVWLVAVVLLPLASILWLLFGRPEHLPRPPRPTALPPRAPDDDPDFLGRIDDELRRRRKRDDPSDPGPGPAPA